MKYYRPKKKKRERIRLLIQAKRTERLRVDGDRAFHKEMRVYINELKAKFGQVPMDQLPIEDQEKLRAMLDRDIAFHDSRMKRQGWTPLGSFILGNQL